MYDLAWNSVLGISCFFPVVFSYRDVNSLDTDFIKTHTKRQFLPHRELIQCPLSRHTALQRNNCRLLLESHKTRKYAVEEFIGP